MFLTHSARRLATSAVTQHHLSFSALVDSYLASCSNNIRQKSHFSTLGSTSAASASSSSFSSSISSTSAAVIPLRTSSAPVRRPSSSSLPRRPRFAPPTDAQFLHLYNRLSPTSKRAPRLLCLDVGDRYVGVAVSENGNSIARPLTTVYRREDVARATEQRVRQQLSPHSHHAHYYDRRRPHTDLRTKHAGRVVERPPEAVYAELRALITEYDCLGIVVGMPLTLSYKMSAQCTKTIDFVRGLQRSYGTPNTPTTAAPVAIEATKPTKPAAATPVVYTVKKLLHAAHRQAADEAEAEVAAASTSSSTASSSTLPLLYWWDERLSSVDARAQLTAAGYSGRKLAVQTDSFAAATILQEFLNRLQLNASQSTSSSTPSTSTRVEMK